MPIITFFTIKKVLRAKAPNSKIPILYMKSCHNPRKNEKIKQKSTDSKKMEEKAPLKIGKENHSSYLTCVAAVQCLLRGKKLPSPPSWDK